MNIGKMMKNLQQMQTRMQAEIETLEVEASSGGGMVTARVNGKRELLSLRIEPDAITPDDPELLGDLVIAAVNEAGRRIDERVAEITRGIAGGMNLPGLT